MSLSTTRALPLYYLRDNELWTRLNCQPYEESWMSAVLAFSRTSPLLLTLIYGGYAYFSETRQLFLLFFGLGLIGDDLINAGVNFFQESIPVVPTCLPVYGSAIALQVQQAAFVVTFALSYVIFYRPALQTWHAAVLALYFVFVVLGMHFLNYHRPAAILFGAALGSFDALVYQIVLYIFVVPLFPMLLRTRLVRSFKYEDTLCGRVERPAFYEALGYDVYANADDGVVAENESVDWTKRSQTKMRAAQRGEQQE